MSNNLTLSNATFNSSGKFGQSLSGGAGLVTGVLAGAQLSAAAWVRATTNGSVVAAFGQGDVLWAGMDASGKAVGHYGKSPDVAISSTVTIGDGAYHYLEICVDSAGAAYLFVDGALAGSSATVSAFNFTSAGNRFGVRLLPYGASTTGLNWPGEVDEVAVYSGVRHTAAYTAPTAPASGTDANLLALWRLDGDGTDNSGSLQNGNATKTVAYDLTLTSATYNSAGKFGSSLSGGYGMASNPIPSSGTFTIEAWAKGTGADYFVVAGADKAAWFGQTNTGKAWAYYGTTDAVATSTVTVNDGAWHHWSWNVDPTGATASNLFIDGVLAATVTAARSLTLTNKFGVKAFNSSGSAGFIWPGEVDEVTVYSGIKRTSAFTPPVVTTSNSDANLLALWHLDGNGADSAGVLTAPDAPAIGTATAGNNQVAVAFTPASTGAAATSFTAVWSGGGSVSGTSSPLTITGLTAGVAGTVHVYASNGAGNSSNSAESNSVTPTAAPTNVVVPFSDAKILWSPYNWDTYGTYKSANNPHAYAKLGFTGTSIAVNVDVSALVSASQPSASYPMVRTIIDGTSHVDTKLTSSTTAITRSGLASGSHTLEMYFLATDANTGDRWTTPVNALRVTGFTLDASASASAPTARSKRHLHFGDSISEGYMANGAGMTQPESNNCLLTVPPALAQMLDAEYGVVAFSGQGYQQASGNVPALLSAWNLFSAGRSRLVSGLLSPAPDYITIEHGANGTTTAANVQTLLAALRTAAPQAKIFQMVTRGGYARAAVTSGEAAVNDANAYLIDIGTGYQAGVSNYTATANMYSVDGLHPNPLANMRAAAAYSEKIQAALDGTTTPATTARTVSVTLGDASGAAASLTGLSVAFYDQATPGAALAPMYKSQSGTTNASGVLSFTVQSTLAVGGTGYVVVYDPATGRHYNGPAVVS